MTQYVIYNTSESQWVAYSELGSDGTISSLNEIVIRKIWFDTYESVEEAAVVEGDQIMTLEEAFVFDNMMKL